MELGACRDGDTEVTAILVSGAIRGGAAHRRAANREGGARARATAGHHGGAVVSGRDGEGHHCATGTRRRGLPIARAAQRRGLAVDDSDRARTATAGTLGVGHRQGHQRAAQAVGAGGGLAEGEGIAVGVRGAVVNGGRGHGTGVGRGHHRDVVALGHGGEVGGAVGVITVRQLEVVVGVVMVADDGEAIAVQHQRGGLADKAGGVHGHDALIAARTVGVVAVRQLEVAVGAVKVADDGEAVAVQHQRGEEADSAGGVHGHDALIAARTIGVVAVHQLEGGDGEVIVADDGEAIAVQHQRGVHADIAGGVHGHDALIAARTVGVVAVHQLEVVVGVVKVTDDGEAVAIEHQRGGLADKAGGVHGHDALIAARTVGVVAVHQLEVVVGEVIVADDGEAVAVQHQRGVEADSAGGVHGLDALIAARTVERRCSAPA